MGTCSFTLSGIAKRSDGRIAVNGVASFSTSYASGGDTLDLSTYFGSNIAVQVFATPIYDSTYIGSYDYTVFHDGGDSDGGKLLIQYLYINCDFVTPSFSYSYIQPVGANLSTFTCNILAIGTP